LKTLCEAGAASITYYETTGMKGMMQQENTALHPLFPAPPNCVYPLFHVLASIQSSRTLNFKFCTTSSPERLIALHAFNDVIRAYWLANLTAQPQTIDLYSRLGGARLLDESTVREATQNAEQFRDNWLNWHSLYQGRCFTLKPYSVAYFEWHSQ
jgi:hypothetical protein